MRLDDAQTSRLFRRMPDKPFVGLYQFPLDNHDHLIELVEREMREKYFRRVFRSPISRHVYKQHAAKGNRHRYI